MNDTTYEERRAVYKAAIEKWGVEAQAFMAVEEMSELTKEICKARRGKNSPADLADEIADVTIMCEQLREIFGVGDLVNERMDYKILRLADRLEEANT